MSGMQYPGPRRSYFQDVGELIVKDGLRAWPASGVPKTHPLTAGMVAKLHTDLDRCDAAVGDLPALMEHFIELITHMLRVAHMSGVPFDDLWEKYIAHKLRGEPFDVAKILQTWQWHGTGSVSPFVDQRVTYYAPGLNVALPGTLHSVNGVNNCIVRLDDNKGDVGGVPWVKDRSLGGGFHFCCPQEASK